MNPGRHVVAVVDATVKAHVDLMPPADEPLLATGGLQQITEIA
jgi:hypothetical protein